MNEFAVQFKNVKKAYKYFTLDLENLELPTGSIMGFIGANGAGKSTTLRLLMGLIRQDMGKIEVLGQPISSNDGCSIWLLRLLARSRAWRWLVRHPS